MYEPRQDQQPWLSYLDDNRVLAGLAAVYGVSLAALLGKLPLGLDEVLQLIAIRAGHHASASLGYSAVWARLPSALLSLLCCLVLVLLVRQLKMRWVAVVLAVFMTLPIQLRYALEASPCSLALFLSVLATALALRAVERRRALVRVGLGIAAAVAALASWYLYSRPFLREAAGGGYWVALPLLAAAGFGLASRRMSRSTKALLGSIIAFSVLASLAGQQKIFILPAIVLLAVEGLRFLYDWRRAAGAALLSAIIVAAYAYDVKWFSLPRADYQLAAAAIKNTAAPDGCVLYFPSDASRLYLFFQPELASRVCDARQPLTPGRQFVLAISPAAPMSEIKPLFARMRKELMIPLQRRAVGGTSITLYQALPAQPNR